MDGWMDGKMDGLQVNEWVDKYDTSSISAAQPQEQGKCIHDGTEQTNGNADREILQKE